MTCTLVGGAAALGRVWHQAGLDRPVGEHHVLVAQRDGAQIGVHPARPDGLVGQRHESGQIDLVVDVDLGLGHRGGSERPGLALDRVGDLFEGVDQFLLVAWQDGAGQIGRAVVIQVDGIGATALGDTVEKVGVVAGNAKTDDEGADVAIVLIEQQIGHPTGIAIAAAVCRAGETPAVTGFVTVTENQQIDRPAAEAIVAVGAGRHRLPLVVPVHEVVHGVADGCRAAGQQGRGVDILWFQGESACCVGSLEVRRVRDVLEVRCYPEIG